MFKVRVMNKIAPAGLRKLDPSNYQIGQDLERYQGMLIRSADPQGAAGHRPGGLGHQQHPHRQVQ